MSHLDSILKILDIKGISSDPKHPEPYSKVFNGVNYIVYHGIQETVGCKCNKCGGRTIKYGYTRTSNIKLPKSLGLPTMLILRKRRYQCKECGLVFQTETNLLDKYCSISNLVRLEVIQEAKTKTSLKDIASRTMISPNSVQRIINKWAVYFEGPCEVLPRVLSIDEFRASTVVENAYMAVSLVDGESHKIIDIRGDRKFKYLVTHFGQYSRKERDKVEYIVMDMYQPFIEVGKKMFPKAKIVIDKFHVVQLATRALNACRVETMKLIEDKVIYKIFKRYWRLLLKNSFKLDLNNAVWVPHLKTYKLELDLIESMLSQSEKLRNTYHVYQSIIKCFSANSVSLFLSIIDDEKERKREKLEEEIIHTDMEVCLKTYTRLKAYIINGIESGYTNGPMEANNNNIKVLKRIAYGYRNYTNFRNRILLVFSDRVPISM